MKNAWKYTVAALAIALAGGSGSVAHAQIQYKTGQWVMPFYEGWVKNADGTFDMTFGYYNLNWEEDIYIPVGPDNAITGLPGGPDHGQPTIFFHRKDIQPAGERREQFVFKVRLPKDWGKTQELVWTLTAHGKTDKIVATLMPVEELDNIVIAENRGGSLLIDNKEPQLALTASAATVALPNSVTLTAVYTDDGLPKPKKTATTSVPGVAPRPPKTSQVKWVYYRGPGLNAVTFDPPRTSVTTSPQTVTTVARFTQPGTYVLRAWADDTSLYTTKEVTITVTGRPATQGQQGAR